MDNHFHLLTGTPRAKLSQFMQRLNTSYALYARYKHRKPGHQFEARFKTKLVGAATTYTLVPGTNRPATATGAESAVFSYDTNGNMTGDGTLTYVYSENQRLIQVSEGVTPLAAR